MARLNAASGLGRDFPSSDGVRKSTRSSEPGQKNGVEVPSFSVVLWYSKRRPQVSTRVPQGHVNSAAM